MVGMIKGVVCILKDRHYYPGSPSINNNGYFTITCVKCGKSESLKLPIDKDINHACHTSKPSI
jgi:hypothetical protein